MSALRKRICRASWSDVLEQFKDRKPGTIQQLANEWSVRMGVDTPTLDENCEVWLEHWNQDQVAEVLQKAAESDPNMIRTKPPRMYDRPMTAFKRGGRFGLIDGRHRANIWATKAGTYPVLVILTE